MWWCVFFCRCRAIFFVLICLFFRFVVLVVVLLWRGVFFMVLLLFVGERSIKVVEFFFGL